MSERMSLVDIEDVLSSIRRLVSEDLRPLTRGAPAKAPEAAKPALILTPALRVVPEAEPEPLPAPTPEASIEEVVAAVAAAVDEQADEWESETGDADLVVDGAWDNAEWDETSAKRPVEDSVGSEEAPLRLTPDMEPEILPAADPDPGATGTEGWGQQGTDDLFVFRSRSVRIDPVEQPDSGWVDQAEAEVIVSLQEPEPEEPIGLLDDSAEMTFDEEVLRDLVRDLIREELQGHLGERITRNIRKLVRAEISRALAAAEFD